ncbi:DUF4959 domain-containing protein [Lentibacillus cibarius]|nr:DUF6273 domain-containing protein [Lentibacillus cibarius]TRM08762.1 DUF4959 domain-containing protein [Lentibacillus cibarius]
MKKTAMILMALLFVLPSIFSEHAHAAAFDNASPGDTIQFGGVEWIVLDPNTGRVIWNESDSNGNPFWKTRTFDDGNSNDWKTSDLKTDLDDNLVNSLDFSNGSSPNDIKKIDLLSESEYKQYATYFDGSILDHNDWDAYWWTKTPSSGSSLVRAVNYAGSVRSPTAAASRGVRPALNLESGISGPPEDTTPPANISNLNSSVTDNKIELSYDLPNDEDFSHISISSNGETYQTTESSFSLEGLESSTDYEITVKSVDNNGNESSGVTRTVATAEPAEMEVTNITTETTDSSITLNYDLPTDIDLNHVNISVNGETFQTTENNYMIDSLEAGASYDITITTVDTSGSESNGVQVTETTAAAPEPQEVNNLEINPEHDKVTLTWENPDTKYFDMAKIYRRSAGEATASAWNLLAPKTVSAAAEYEPLFETNGTEFIDHSVEPETNYDYKVTTTYNGMESAG